MDDDGLHEIVANTDLYFRSGQRYTCWVAQQSILDVLLCRAVPSRNQLSVFYATLGCLEEVAPSR
ncbi:hypothetical protein ASF27_00055 [Methylobacterium sp. Leaf102]|nr:hypothetical protein ASF22_05195 [Methylobacterium sp. Leaf87]KQP34013.1 hypothetical protein ASF27_00055 [Methylobacterium sp. Leaf102]